jgi:hypothetical protein
MEPSRSPGPEPAPPLPDRLDAAARRQLLSFAVAGLLAVTVAAALWRERLEPLTLLPAAVSLAALLGVTSWWRTRRAVSAALILNTALIFVFLWSLDEREHVIIRAGTAQYQGSVGTGSSILPVQVIAGRFGLYAGTLDDYRVSPTGEAQTTGSSDAPLNRFGAWMRFSLGPAWTNIHIIRNGSFVPASTPTVVSGSWSVDRRGEWEGSPGSSILLGSTPPGNYTIEADLMRGDGTQGLLVGVDASDVGYVFAPRVDRPDMLWMQWSAGGEGDGYSAAFTQFPFVTMLQRDIRLLLANVIAAQILLLLALPVYLLLTLAFRLAGGAVEDELRPLERLTSRPRLMAAAAACVAIAATVCTALIASSLLERIPHVQDSVADLFQAKTLALGRLWVPQPKLPAFFTEEFIPNHDGRWFGKYPPGWPVLLTAGVLLHAPWLVDPVLAGADVFLIYLIGREAYSRPIGLLAALLTLSSPFFLFLGGSFMPHTATLFYLSGAAYLFIRWSNRASSGERAGPPAARLLLPAGFLLGMGLITRQLDGVAFALPFAVLLVPSLRRRDLRPALLLALGAIVPLAAMVLYDWDLTGSPLTSPYALWWPFDKVGFGRHVGLSGFTPAGGLWNTSINLQMLLAHLFGWPFYLTLALAAVPFLTGRANRWDALFLASALAIITAYVAYWNPGTMFGPRYYYTAIPWFALLSARGLEEMYRWPLRLPILRGHDAVAALMVPAALLALLVSYNLTIYIPAQIPIYRGYNFTSAASMEAVRAANIHHALIFVVTPPPYGWWSYGSVFSSNSPLLNGDIVYARDLGTSNILLMRRYPDRTYYRLDGTTITPLSSS